MTLALRPQCAVCRLVLQLPDVIHHSWDYYHKETRWCGVTIAGGVDQSGNLTQFCNLVSKDYKERSLVHYLCERAGWSQDRWNAEILNWLQNIFDAPATPSPELEPMEFTLAKLLKAHADQCVRQAEEGSNDQAIDEHDTPHNSTGKLAQRDCKVQDSLGADDQVIELADKAMEEDGPEKPIDLHDTSDELQSDQVCTKPGCKYLCVPEQIPPCPTHVEEICKVRKQDIVELIESLMTRSPIKRETPCSSPVKRETPCGSPVKRETLRGSPVESDPRTPPRIQASALRTPSNGRQTWTTRSGSLVTPTKTIPSERSGVPVRKKDVLDDKFPEVREVIAESVKAHKAAAVAEREREAVEYIVISDTETVEKPRPKARGNNVGVGPVRPCKKSIKRRRSNVDEVESIEISDVKKNAATIPVPQGRTLQVETTNDLNAQGADEDSGITNVLNTESAPTVDQTTTNTSVTVVRPTAMCTSRTFHGTSSSSASSAGDLTTVEYPPKGELDLRVVIWLGPKAVVIVERNIPVVFRFMDLKNASKMSAVMPDTMIKIWSEYIGDWVWHRCDNMLTMRSRRFLVLVCLAAAVEIDQGEFFQELSLLMNGVHVQVI
ncbi:hypothetical protein EW026_g5485 [Hermanssonia centrifuga]|uniref:Uncharacterized protein n=1 Tax=Hermanssonia centrifuga TaxID=98765 RepID=A0A4S4KE07_9APHY|nr:hypothetical protein EW026_g5485 [Hermanssonia centrifuga]